MIAFAHRAIGISFDLAEGYYRTECAKILCNGFSLHSPTFLAYYIRILRGKVYFEPPYCALLKILVSG